MPTPRRNGAPLVRIALTTPAFMGLNKQSETSILGPEWATIATNVVFDTSGRLSSRKGWLSLSSTAMSGSPQIEQLHEQVASDGTTSVISAAGGRLWLGTSPPADITGASTVTVGNNWQFVNFGSELYGFQQGEQPIGRTTGNFSDTTASSGSWPMGNCALVHSGRIWAVDSDKQTIKYCALLQATKWAVADGGGSIDMTSVWPQGTDEVVALAMYNGQMVVFGKNRIVLFGDGAGSALGINPSNIYVIDTVVGVGCVARDSVQQIEGGDILFLSAQGVQSLGRLIQEKSNPIHNISSNIRDYMAALVGAETLTKVRSVYSPEESFYLLVLPTMSKVFCFDTSGRLQDGTLRVTEWDMALYAVSRRLTGELLMSLTSPKGKIGRYFGYADDTTTYNMDYASAWLDLGEDAAQYIKILKNIKGIFYITGSATVQLKWDFDFQGDFTSRTLSVFAPGTSEWGLMEWGIGEWSGGLALRTISSPVSGSGQYIRIGAQATITSQVSIQELTLYTKIGRLAK